MAWASGRHWLWLGPLDQRTTGTRTLTPPFLHLLHFPVSMSLSFYLFLSFSKFLLLQYWLGTFPFFLFAFVPLSFVYCLCLPLPKPIHTSHLIVTFIVICLCFGAFVSTLFIRTKSDHSLPLSVPESLSHAVETWLMWPWLSKIQATSSTVMQPLLALLNKILQNQNAEVWSEFWSFVVAFCKSSRSRSCRWLYHGEIVFVVCCCNATDMLLLCCCLLQNQPKLEFAHELSQF